MVAKKGSRLGVGAVSSTSASSSEANVSEDWTKNIKKQILSVGKKRSYVADYGDDDDAGGFDNNSSSDDEEEGRTTAVKERKKKKARQTDVTPVLTDGDALVVEEEANPITSTNTVTTKSKKKKKKGKKERAQEQQPQAVQDAEDTAVASTTIATTTTPNDTEQNTTPTAVEPGNTGSNSNTKRKRKKVRSKQKNIAKDNRTANEKPSHLVLGRADYSGRPMTQTTKDKLGIKTKTKVKSNKTAKLDDAFESGEWVDEAGLKGGNVADVNTAKPADNGDNNHDIGEPTEKPQKEEGSLKKIGDCIVSMNNDDAGEPMTKKKKKSKKKKYKNV